VDEFLDSLDRRARAKTLKWLALLEEHGPDLPRPYADTLQGPIRELRVGFGRIEARLLHFFHKSMIVIVTHGFLKKARAVPQIEIDRAVRARTNWLNRYGGNK
jgi:hypothetical protein